MDIIYKLSHWILSSKIIQSNRLLSFVFTVCQTTVVLTVSGGVAAAQLSDPLGILVQR